MVMKKNDYASKKKKLRLKRSRKKVFVFPLFLLIPVLVLSLLSLYRHNLVNDIQADISVQDKKNISNEISSKVNQAQDQENKTAGTGPGKKVVCSGTKVDKEPQANSTRKIKDVVQAGDTMTEILSDYLTVPEIYVLGRKCQDIFPLQRIKSGHAYRMILENNQLQRFEYEIDSEQKLKINVAKNGEFSIAKAKIDYTVKNEVVQGVIENNLFKSMNESGESPNLAIALANIFAWDIDFIRDIRKGDSFKLIVEKRYRKGAFDNYGDILAARFTNRGDDFMAFLYELDKRAEYFDSQGKSVRKTFLKAPLNFTRISSGYSLHRKHPILNVVRPHQGIDYAAPTGTPIKTVADGVVICRRYARHAGRYIKIRHCNSYVTVYNHMSRFARGIKRGSRVQQGDVIGYVGSTGLATGPHLDFRVKQNGHYRNPLKIESDPAKPIPESQMKRFQAKIKPLLAVLEGQKPHLAMISKGENS